MKITTINMILMNRTIERDNKEFCSKEMVLQIK